MIARNQSRYWHRCVAVPVVLALLMGAGCDTKASNGQSAAADSNASDQPNLDSNDAPVTTGDWFRPTADSTWQWQLQPGAPGRINTHYDVRVYDIDLFDVDASVIARLQADGRKVICYFSAGSFESFRADAGRFLPTDHGRLLGDFPDERWLDIRSSNVRDIMLARLDLAVQKGCDGVEPDNVTGFENDTGFNLTADDQLAFNRFLSNESHRRNLAVGLKNDLSQIPDLIAFFDFSVSEQCHEFDECELLKPFTDVDKPVFNAEYADRFVNDVGARNALCSSARDNNLRTLVLPIDLDDAFRFTCDP